MPALDSSSFSLSGTILTKIADVPGGDLILTKSLNLGRDLEHGVKWVFEATRDMKLNAKPDNPGSKPHGLITQDQLGMISVIDRGESINMVITTDRTPRTTNRSMAGPTPRSAWSGQPNT